MTPATPYQLDQYVKQSSNVKQEQIFIQQPVHSYHPLSLSLLQYML